MKQDYELFERPDTYVPDQLEVFNKILEQEEAKDPKDPDDEDDPQDRSEDPEFDDTDNY